MAIRLSLLEGREWFPLWGGDHLPMPGAVVLGGSGEWFRQVGPYFRSRLAEVVLRCNLAYLIPDQGRNHLGTTLGAVLEPLRVSGGGLRHCPPGACDGVSLLVTPLQVVPTWFPIRPRRARRRSGTASGT